MEEGRLNAAPRRFAWSTWSGRKRLAVVGAVVVASYGALASLVALTAKLYPEERVDLVLLCIPWLEGCDVNWGAFGAFAAMVGGAATATAAWMAMRAARMANAAQKLTLITAEVTKVNDTLKWLELAEWDLRRLETGLVNANAANTAAPEAGRAYARAIERLREQMRLPFADHEMRRLMRVITAEHVDAAREHGEAAIGLLIKIQDQQRLMPALGGSVERELVGSLERRVQSLVECLRLARSALKCQIDREMREYASSRAAIEQLLK